MFERAKGGERAILIHVAFTGPANPEDIQELRELALSAGAEIATVLTVQRRNPDPKYFIGSGKAEEIKALLQQEQAELVIINNALTPAQERNLEGLFECRVLDRTSLILDIFAQRARSFEGKLQVELALLRHISTRLVRGWTHLERQKGGIGLRGPGETQLESDRRIIRDKIKLIQKRLEKVRLQRQQGRRTRQRATIPTVAFVGYTNAGKSTLFNRLTQAHVYAADQLFATLDPTLRRVGFSAGGQAILADTVGFVRELPHELIAAFQATLEEVHDADLLVHVIDYSDDASLDRIQQVNDVLHELKADQIPQLLVYNKIDLTENHEPRIEYDQDKKPRRVWLSALQDHGINLLQDGLSQLLFGDPVYRHICLKPQEGQLRSQLYSLNAVQKETVDEEGNYWLSICITKPDFIRLFGNEEPLTDTDSNTEEDT